MRQHGVKMIVKISKPAWVGDSRLFVSLSLSPRALIFDCQPNPALAGSRFTLPPSKEGWNVCLYNISYQSAAMELYIDDTCNYHKQAINNGKHHIGK